MLLWADSTGRENLDCFVADALRAVFPKVSNCVDEFLKCCADSGGSEVRPGKSPMLAFLAGLAPQDYMYAKLYEKLMSSDAPSDSYDRVRTELRALLATADLWGKFEDLLR